MTHTLKPIQPHPAIIVQLIGQAHHITTTATAGSHFVLEPHSPRSHFVSPTAAIADARNTRSSRPGESGVVLLL